MKVLVTGANSLLGINVIAVLLDRGFQVRTLTRRPDSIPLDTLDIQEYIGHITRREDVFQAVRGCDVVIHIAANTSQNSMRYRDYSEVNVRATQHVLDAAKTFAVKKTILVSSANAFGYGTYEAPGHEELPFGYPFTKTCYARSKKEAQDLALEYPREGMGDIIVVNPTFMIGRFDTKPSSGKIITMNYKKRVNFVPPGGKNFVHVQDVAEATCNAIEFGKDRQCYLLSGENLSYREFYQKMHDVTSYKGYAFRIPRGLLLVAGALGTCLYRLGIKTNVHYYNMRILCVKNYYSNAKARKALKLKSRPISDAIQDAVAWFQQSGMLKN